MSSIMPHIGGPELLIVFFVAMLIFGVHKLPKLGGSLGSAMKEFKAAKDGTNKTE